MFLHLSQSTVDAAKERQTLAWPQVLPQVTRRPDWNFFIPA